MISFQEKIKALCEKFGVEEKDLNYRLDGRIEWVCEHGVGHPIWWPTGGTSVHGCCGCCSRFKGVYDE